MCKALFMHPDRPNTHRLFLASCLALFAELAIIRWLSTEVRIFAYAKNLALLLCFLGFGVGCALAPKRVYWWKSIQAILAVILLVRNPWAPRLFERLSQTLGAGQDIAIWSTGTIRNWPNIILDAVIVGLLFFFLTTIFIPLGQIVSQELDSAPDRLRAYSWNLGASLFGIMLFSFVSFRALSPVFWFGLVLLGFALLQANWRRRFAVASLIVPAVLLLHEKATPDHFAIWTPYQQIDIHRYYFKTREWLATLVNVNHVGYQVIVNLSSEFLSRHPGLLQQPADESPYNLPFRFTVANPSVLVVGAGTGNDVAAAVRGNSRSIDAVEIDPAILNLGRTHPERPYESSTVSAHLTDARAFMKRTDKHYDLVLMGLLDSHTQQSEYANMRIDNYVYTEESLREARNLLSPNGTLFLKFQVDRDWLGRRLYMLLTRVFGKLPVVFLAESSYGAGATCFVISASEEVENSIARDPRLRTFVERQKRTFDSTPPVPITTDDWPYLYQEKKSIPAVFLTLSTLVLLLAFYYRRSISTSHVRQSSLFFFAMGAGFMLLETQIVSRLALFFGTTWQVNSVAIASVLTALVVANIVMDKYSQRFNRWWILVGLQIVLVSIYLVRFARIPGSALAVGSLAAGLFTVPVFFAGLLFAREFRSTPSPSAALAANMLGAVVGGLMENLSLVIGLKALLLIAALFYLVAGIGLRNASPSESTVFNSTGERESDQVADSV
jgi:SAM-dependent methyltransferase